MPPGQAGNPDWLPAAVPCEQRFYAGGALASEPCACGRYSIGRCKDCGRPLCGDHGTQSGPFLCAACFTKRRALYRQKEEEARQDAARSAREAEAEFARVKERALSELSAAATSVDIVSVLRQMRDYVTVDACKSAWLRVLETEKLIPTYELVRVRALPHFLILDWQQDTGWLWHSTGPRTDGWCTEQEDDEIFLDRDGQCWRGPRALSPECSPNIVALPRGAPFRATFCPQSLGPLLLKDAKERQPRFGVAVGQVDLSNSETADVIVRILESMATPR
jgi:uncharacterized Zn finger protein (UPF0148 family)